MMDTTEVMPMMMPSMVSMVRKRLASIASIAILKASLMRSRQAGPGLALRGARSSAAASAAPAALSRRISPSRISMMRSVCAAMAGS